MATALSSSDRRLDPAEAARRHFVLRFSVATTAAFIICEWMGWQPSALAPVLTGVLLANLPASPPLKVGLSLVVIMAISAWLSFLLTTYLTQAPHILFLIVGLLMFVAFHGLAQAKAQLPLTLLLICLTVIPLMTLTVPQAGALLTAVLVRGMALAMVFTWCAFAIWPIPAPKGPDQDSAHFDSPIVAATLATATVLPLVLIYLLFGLTDAIPVLLTTVLIIAKMEQERGAASAKGKLIGNFVGGLVAIAAYYVLQIAPSLAALALITFIVGIGFAEQIAKGGVRGGNALLAYNATMIVLGLALLKDDSNSGTWGTRLVQFAIACTFAVGMMTLLRPSTKASGAAEAR
jgi:hypothetical protein